MIRTRRTFRKTSRKPVRLFADLDCTQLEDRIVPAYVAGDFGWASTIESVNVSIEDQVRSSVVDASGNVYQVGSFTGTVDFDPGAGTQNLTAVGGSDAFVLKLDATGQFQWVNAFAGAANEKVTSITLDASGNPLVTGWYQGTTDYDPGAGVTNRTSAGAEDAFFTKLGSDGSLLWVKTFGGSGSHAGRTITTDSAGNILLGGESYNTVDFDPGSNVTSITTNSGSPDIFISKFDSAGNFTWVKGIIGLNNKTKTIWDAQTDSSNNVLICGSFSGIIDIDPGTGTTHLSNASTNYNGFFTKLDSSGNFQWGQQIASTTASRVFSVTSDADNNLYVGGGFHGTVDFDPGSAAFNLSSKGVHDAFLEKLGPDGSLKWAQSWGGTSDDCVKFVTLDKNNNIKLAGIYQNTVDFDPSADTMSFTSTGATDEFVSVFAQYGSFFGVQTVGQPNANENLYSTTITPTGRPVLAGLFTGTMDFAPDGPNKSLPVVGASNTFITQWNRDFTKTTDSVSDSLSGANTTLTATIQSENSLSSTGTVTFSDTFN